MLKHLRHFIKFLAQRTSNIDLSEVRPVLIVANLDLVRREWPQLENIPEVYVFDGSLLSRHHLNAINIIICRICVILTQSSVDDSSPELIDKLSIMADINVRAFTFDDSKLNLLSLRSNNDKPSDESVIKDILVKK